MILSLILYGIYYSINERYTPQPYFKKGTRGLFYPHNSIKNNKRIYIYNQIASNKHFIEISNKKYKYLLIYIKNQVKTK